MSYTKTNFGPSTVKNFCLLRSTWPGWFYTDEKIMPLAVFAPKGSEIPKIVEESVCPGSCAFCDRCWKLLPGQVTIFKQH